MRIVRIPRSGDSIAMRIIRIPRSDRNSRDVILPYDGMKVDPRIMGGYYGGKYSFSVNGRILTITKIVCSEEDGRPGWDNDFFLRAYVQDFPDFTTTVYTYWGLDYEEAPFDTTVLIFHPSVRTIREYAFSHCKSLLRVTIPDTVTRIEEYAFFHCHSLRYIQLSRNLVSIGLQAFCNCTSLQDVYLPPTVTQIGDYAFADCESLRFLFLPEDIEHIGNAVVDGCNRLLTTVNYRFDDEDEDDIDPINNDEVNQWLMQRHANLPFHQACSSIYITPQVIVHGIERATEVDEYQMTALHILCANPHVTPDCIRAYLQLAPEAADQEDSDGMTPLQYLSRNDITFVQEERNFSSLMIWWYHCMPPQTFAYLDVLMPES